MLILTFLSGFGLRPLEAQLNSPITKNKILMGSLAIVSWIGLLSIRIKAGPNLWDRQGMIPHMAYMMSFSGVLFLISTNSVGGDLASIPSGYEEIAKALGFQTRHAFYFPTWANLLLWSIGLVVLIWGIITRQKRRQSSEF